MGSYGVSERYFISIIICSLAQTSIARCEGIRLNETT